MLPPLDPALIEAIVERLLENGWHPIPLAWGSKKPLPGIRWKGRRFRGRDFAALVMRHGLIGIGLRLDGLLVVDNDIDEPKAARWADQLTELMLGPTPAVRRGRYPRQASFYRYPEGTFTPWSEPGFECRGGPSQYMVGFGRHPLTGDPFEWIADGGSPLDMRVNDLPIATLSGLNELQLMISPKATSPSAVPQAPAPVVRRQGLIADGRDAHLRDLVAAEIGRIKGLGGPLRADEIVNAAWAQFQVTADLSRPKGRGGGPWTQRDVEVKVRYALQPSRSARINAARSRGFWTLQRKLDLKAVIDADPRLTPADRQVGWTMLQAVRDQRGLSYCSSATLAREAGLHAVTVRASRRRLIQFKYFEEVREGGQNRPTVCRANPKLVEGIRPAKRLGVVQVSEAFSA